MRHISLALFLLSLNLTLACNDGKKSKSPQPVSSPVVKLPGADAERRNPQVPLKPAPLPPLAAEPPPVQGPPNSLPIDSAEMQFLNSVKGRWRTGCELIEATGVSRFYAIEFKDQEWSTMIFDYMDNEACIHMAAPNEGLPRVYSLSLQAQPEGWFKLQGMCLTAGNECQGVQEVLVKVEAESKVLRLKKVSGEGLWLDSSLSEMEYN